MGFHTAASHVTVRQSSQGLPCISHAVQTCCMGKAVGAIPSYKAQLRCWVFHISPFELTDLCFGDCRIYKQVRRDMLYGLGNWRDCTCCDQWSLLALFRAAGAALHAVRVGQPGVPGHAAEARDYAGHAGRHALPLLLLSR